MPGEDPKATPAPNAPPASGRLEALMAAVRDAGGRGPAPVEKWDPPDCGEMDLVIKADGSWHYMGTPIGRPALVRLFASVLAREGERYVLKTPVEKVGLTVEDAPFLAVEMAVEDAGNGATESRTLVFRTNLDDLVHCGPGHALRFAPGSAPGQVVPYVHVRRGLDARLTRAVHLDLMAEGEVRDDGGVPMFGVASAGVFYPILPAADLDLSE
ncbi:DUF1285 domain-containing protein [Xanthobacter autotrophicus]|uniref:DUF1285 domain-containing protein n=1 Tax=Xanthobacter autotrophicus TaxID=280 RepID=UPI0024A70916|nr:DUF1285 domain-containing protein [Xanthobacter autotrophicus]MDI4658049.1 DUF1285 domain-containing protein [Xanthobacter autotrophicus]